MLSADEANRLLAEGSFRRPADRGKLASAIEALRWYRIKFAAADLGDWDAHAHLAATNRLHALGEPSITSKEAAALVREWEANNAR